MGDINFQPMLATVINCPRKSMWVDKNFGLVGATFVLPSNIQCVGRKSLRRLRGRGGVLDPGD